MADENDKVNFKGMTIIPSLSLNKHVSAVHNYSLQDAIDMRMSNDRTHLQNIEDIINSPAIENFLNENKSIYGEVSYDNFIIENNNSFADVVTTYLDGIGHDYQDEQNIYNAIKNCYANVNFSNCTLDELINLVRDINSFATHDQLSSGDEQHVDEFVRTLTILSDSKYNIIDVCPCKNELVIFVKDVDIADNINMTILRYNEETNIVYRAYSNYIPYYDGKLSFDYTYNVNGDLILAFCEYDGNEKQPLRTINLNEQLYPSADINLSHDKLTIKPAIELSNFDDVFYQSGSGYTGWHYIYIQYKINEGRYTEWYRMGFPIKLLKNARNVLFTDDCTNPKTGSNSVKYGNNFVLNTGYINKTYNFEFNIDVSFYQYRIGIIVANNTIRKHFVTEFVDCVSNKETFVFDTTVLKEEDFSTETRQNFYNVKNIVNYKNRIYCANYETYSFGDIDTNPIKLYTKVIDKRDIIIPEVRTDSVTLANNSSISIPKDAYNFENNILWFLLTLHYQKTSLGILDALSHVTSGILYIRRQGVRPSGGFGTVEYRAKIENVYYEIKACVVSYGNNQTATVYYPIIKFLDLNGDSYTFTPFYNDAEPTTWTWDSITQDYLNLIKIGYGTMTSEGHTNCTQNTIISYALVYVQLLNPSDPQYDWNWSNPKMPAFSKYLYLYYGSLDIPSRVIWQSEDTTSNNYQKIDSTYYSAEYLINAHPTDLIITTISDYTQNKEYYLTTLPNNEVFDFYIHFINKYGEISDGYKLVNNHGIIKINNNDYVIFQSIIDAHFYYLPADKKIKDIDTNSDIFYSNSVPLPYASPSIIQYNNLPSDIKNYFEDIKFKNLYTNNLSNYSTVSSQGSGLFNFIPYYNGTRHLFKVNGEHVHDYETQELFIDFNNFDFDNIAGYFISYNKIEFTINSVGVRIPASSSVLIQITQYYSLLNDILDYKSFGNFISDVIKSGVKPFYSVNDIYQAGYKEKTITNNISLIYSSISDLELAYAGENKFGRRGKSTILTELENLTSRESEFIKAISGTDAYISLLSNINNNFYLNEPTLYKFSNYYYNNSNRILKGNNLGEWYNLTHILYNESGVCYSYKVDPDEQDTNKIDMEIDNLDNVKYEENTDNLIPVGIVNTKFVSLHSFNIETKSNPFQIGNKIFIAAINTLNYFGQFIKECWEYDEFIFQKYDKYKQKNKFTNTIIYSNVISDETAINRWEEFLAESYKFISENKGEIVNLAVIGNTIFIHCLHAIYILEFKDYLATTEESLQIIQSSIKDIEYKEIFPTDKGYCGLQDKEASIVGNFGYIFYENDTNRLLRLDAGKLIYMDYSITQWLKKYKPYEVRFANDVERNNIIIELKYIINNNTKILTLVYDYEINAFISRLNNVSFINGRNTKNKLYFIKDNKNITEFDNIHRKKDTLQIPIIKLEDSIPEYKKITNKLSFIFNDEYFAIKFIENIEWNLYKYYFAEDYKTELNNPIENYRKIYPGDYIRIYNDLIDTGWINIKENELSNDSNEYNNQNINKPFYYLGKYIMNLFRNVKSRVGSDYSIPPTFKTYSEADDRARLYGKWFIIEFGFNTKDYDDPGDLIEFENIKVNVSQQTNIQ